MNDKRGKANTSRARSGHGINNPENVSKYNVTQAGKRVALIIRWDGNGYDKSSCWIRGSVDDIIDLDTNL